MIGKITFLRTLQTLKIKEVVSFLWNYEYPNRWLLQFLVIADLFFMTRGYAISNLIEHILIFIVIGSKNYRRNLKEFFKTPLGICIISLFFWFLLSISWSETGFAEALDSNWGWRKILLIPIAFVAFRELENAQVIHLSIVACCSIFCLLSFGMYFSETSEFWGRSAWNILQNHSIQGVLFSFCFYTMLIHADEAYRAGDEIYKYFLFIGLGFFINLIFVGTGVSGYISLIIFSCLLVIFFIRDYMIYILLVCSILICLTLIAPDTPEISLGVNHIIAVFFQGQSAIDESLSSSLQRLEFWSNTLVIIRDNPVLGVGAGSFELAYADVLSSQGSNPDSVITDNPHQQFLHVMAEYGAIGLVIFGTFIFYLCKLVSLDTLDGKVFAGLLVVLVALGLINGTLTDIILSRVLYILAGLMVVINVLGVRVDATK